ncbi:hypothetical protein ABSDF_p30026 (plasmid) [Acinetobacter baumannii SDF]|uniref:Uncharacterized protein n=1 Tax=Acinetobacter baumannii (strain SDF) TaxID=509170 RepID=B0VVC0_ACIBS|nr:hypothetical protein ABSDF_p20007 [Acinetobacter baumannii SDF]CAP03000.1 hypothetical protein ABSDF_p30026 [Acinetobacter baumannii SDF]
MYLKLLLYRLNESGHPIEFEKANLPQGLSAEIADSFRGWGIELSGKIAKSTAF